MSFRVYCDGYVLHDSNLEQFKLISPKLEIAVNKSGQFTFRISYTHPYYNMIVNKKSYIEIYENGQWLWSGRPIIIKIPMKLHKTVTCEGELSFLHDSNQRLAEYHNISVSDYFTMIINKHNSQVEANKQFTVGNVTVEDNNDELYRFSNYEDTFETIEDKLIKRLGGYVVIRHENGTKYIDYVKAYPYVMNQTIKFGSNIIDLSLDDSSEDMISAIIPLGAKLNDDSEERVTVESVNNGLDYIVNDDAVERFGKVFDTVVFDNVTEPSNLMRKGYEELIGRIYSKLVVSLKVFDRSYIENNYEKFKLGAMVVADSKKHGLDNVEMMISKMTISLTNIADTTIETGVTKRSISGSIVDNNSNFNTKVETIVDDYIKNEYVTVIKPSIEETKSLIEQTADSLRTEVSEKYISISEQESIYKYIQTMVNQSASDIEMTFINRIENVENTVNINSQNLERYIRFSIDGIELGEIDSPFKTNITNTEVYFSENGNKIAYISNSKLYIFNAHIIETFTMGIEERGFYDWVVGSDKHLTLTYRGGEG